MPKLQLNNIVSTDDGGVEMVKSIIDIAKLTIGSIVEEYRNSDARDVIDKTFIPIIIGYAKSIQQYVENVRVFCMGYVYDLTIDNQEFFLNTIHFFSDFRGFLSSHIHAIRKCKKQEKSLFTSSLAIDSTDFTFSIAQRQKSLTLFPKEIEELQIENKEQLLSLHKDIDALVMNNPIDVCMEYLLSPVLTISQLMESAEIEVSKIQNDANSPVPQILLQKSYDKYISSEQSLKIREMAFNLQNMSNVQLAEVMEQNRKCIEANQMYQTIVGEKNSFTKEGAALIYKQSTTTSEVLQGAFDLKYLRDALHDVHNQRALQNDNVDINKELQFLPEEYRTNDMYINLYYEAEDLLYYGCGGLVKCKDVAAFYIWLCMDYLHLEQMPHQTDVNIASLSKLIKRLVPKVGNLNDNHIRETLKDLYGKTAEELHNCLDEDIENRILKIKTQKEKLDKKDLKKEEPKTE